MAKKLTLAELAKFADVTDRTVANWRKAGMPLLEEKRGRSLLVDSAEFLRWYAEHHVDRGKEIKRQTEVDWTSEKRRIEVEERLGRLLERDDVIRTWDELVAGIRKMVLSIPNRVAGLVAMKPEREARQILADEVKQILREAVAYDEERRRQHDEAG